MYYTSTYQYILLFLSLLINVSCSHIPTDIENKEPKGISISNELSSEDLTNYKKALYALKNNEYGDSEKLLQNVIERHPDLAGPHANLGLIYYKMEKYSQSTKSLKKTLSLNPKNPYAYNILGLISKNKGDLSNSKKYFLLAIKYKKDYAKAHYNIALLYDIYFQEIKESIYHYNEYLKIINIKNIKDEKTNSWVKQLENSLSKGKKNV